MQTLADKLRQDSSEANKNLEEELFQMLLEQCKKAAKEGKSFFEHREYLPEKTFLPLKEKLSVPELGFKVRITTSQEIMEHNKKHIFDMHFQYDIRDRIFISWKGE